MLSFGSMAPLFINIVFISLVAASFISWVIIVFKALQLYDAHKCNKEFTRLFWDTRDLSRIETLSVRLQASPLVKVFGAGFRELNRIIQEHQATKEPVNTASELGVLEMALRRSELQEAQRLERGCTFLATVTSAAPFIGLFGTVLGIMDAFSGLGLGGTSTIQAVAPGISHALEATAIGLAAAIPAAIAYNYISVVIRQFKESMDRFSLEFLSFAEKQYVAPGGK